ncbi:MAG: protein kinase [Actinomycetota bacterium]
MSYCPECGEQIAKEDVFCPFCGIALTPTTAANDNSTSETIVSMPVVAINQEALNALSEKSKIETTIAEPISEPQDKTEITENAEQAIANTPGDTAENWNMKTDSVEIPAEMFEEVGVPLPEVINEAELKSPPVIVPEAVKSEETKPPFDEAVKVSEPINKFPELQNLPDISTPVIIQNSDFEFKTKADEQTPEPQTSFVKNEIATERPDSDKFVETLAISDKKEFPAGETIEPEVFEPLISAPIAEQKESPIKAENSPISDAAENKVKDFELVPTEIPSNFAEEDLSSDIIQPISDVPEKFTVDEPQDLVVKPKFNSQNFEDTPSFLVETAPEAVKLEAPEIQTNNEPPIESSNMQEIEETPNPKIFEPPISMPDVPLLLENQDDQTKFDSVQIIQKDEIPENKIEEPVQEVAAVSPAIEPELPLSTTEDKPKEGRSFTTPNMVNADTDGRKSAKLKPLEEGVILNNRYEIVRKIGGGGMGAVYLANDRNLGGVLRAVKEMVQSYIESEQQDKAISDFKRESLLLTSLDHPAIPTIYDYFYDEKEARFYLVMKYISGGDLAGRLRAAPEGRVDEKSVTEWAIQVADVLDYLHNHEPSIVYRDLKPANVMIDGNSGRVMLIDFGIARWVNKEEKGVTAVGTMGYAPPELFSGNVEARSDIYSLGSTMFHLLTGADPQSNPLLIFDFQKNPRPRQINSQLSDQIERILMRSVEYNADMRFASAGQLRDELKEHLSNLQSGKVSFGIKSAPSPPTFSEQSVFCGFCGRQIVATDVFCAFCGAQQPIAQQNFSQPANSAQPLTAKLIIIGTGELEPSSFKLEKHENLLGRRDPMSNIFPEVDLSKYDPQTKISRRHARIWREGNSFLVEDLGSSNGTTLLPAISDSIRLLPHQPHPLTSGDKIRLGDTTLHFTFG